MPHKRRPAKRKVFSVQDGRRDVCPEFRLLLGRIVVGCDASGLPLWPGNQSSIALFGQPKSREQEEENSGDADPRASRGRILRRLGARSAMPTVAASSA